MTPEEIVRRCVYDPDNGRPALHGYKKRGPFFTSPIVFALFFSLLAILIGVVGWAVVG